MGSGEFSGPGQTPAIRQAPPFHFGGIRPLPNRTTATITSVTAPVVIMGPRDSPEPLWGPGNFQGRGKRQPSGRHRPSTLVELGKLPNRTTASITSVAAPVVTMLVMEVCPPPLRWGDHSSLGIAQNNQVSAPWVNPNNSGAGLYPKGYSYPTPRGLAKSHGKALNRGFQRGIPAAREQFLLQLWNRTSVRSVGSFSLQELRSDVMALYRAIRWNRRS